MITANTATYDARSHLMPIPASTARATAGRRKLPESRVYFLPGTGHPTSPYAAADNRAMQAETVLKVVEKKID